MSNLQKACDALRVALRSSSRSNPVYNLQVARNDAMQLAGLFDAARAESDAVIAAFDALDPNDAGNVPVFRAVGSMLGMAVADSLGHNFEFLPVRDTIDKRGPYFEYPCDAQPGGRVHRPLNEFQLRAGQWTDDTSMGLCQADSLISSEGYSGSNIRMWFWNWWNNGLNNAFRFDRERLQFGGRGSLSVGLGGNISKSLNEISREARAQRPPPERFTAEGEDAGNGSLMRLAPIPLWFHKDLAKARQFSFESSLTTHPGPLAAEACAFMAHVLVTAIHRPADDATSLADFLDAVRDDYPKILGDKPSHAQSELCRLLRSEEPNESTERCWNWRNKNLGIERTLKNRGRQYNGYPVSAGYFGAFSLDGLALALHCLYHTSSFNEAVAKVVNFCGDADTTGAICAQMAGSFYGAQTIEPVWANSVRVWDHRDIELRALVLFFTGDRRPGDASAGATDESASQSASTHDANDDA